MMPQTIIAALVLAFAVITDAEQAKSRMRARSKSLWAPRNPMKPVFVPPTMLLMSSPMERKVSYTQISNSKSVGGVVLPILDAGLQGPTGIAWDSPRKALYVADAALRKIFRVKLKAFKCKRQCKGIEYQLAVDGNQFTIVENIISTSVSVDPAGNLFFTDQDSNSVNKLPVATIHQIVEGKLLPKNLARTSESEYEGEEAAEESAEAASAIEGKEGKATTPTVTPRPPSIFSLYEKGVSPNVGTPAGVAVDGSQLYWTNQVGGFSSGAVSFGKKDPRVKDTDGSEEGKPTFPSTKLANNTGSAYGVAVTSSKVVFTATQHYVYAASRGSGEVVALTSDLLKPRGVVWDGDNTVFVADQEGNFVVSLPCGLLKEGAPISHVVDFHSPFGIALVKSGDPVWAPIVALEGGGAPHSAQAGSLVMVIAMIALLLTLGRSDA